eukprot:CAMPEP_0196139050 /NCGR_PEP_ID=MMETSP0910-20130528/6463_1 /TAXON_ID=49265 /ORGANISM="Thalassiosira rotula, Strain GSO102" /LENGTH=187 /DNA_ID=CAMNT_0041399727 /DNA_START=28 /DNA_END=591 /DNA_ORIENTATION=-
MAMRLILSFLLATYVAAFAPPRSPHPAAFHSVTTTTTTLPLPLPLPSSNNRLNRSKPCSNSELFIFGKKAETTEEVTTTTEEEETESAKGFAAIKAAGKAGAISLFLWEAAFWIIAVPIVSVGYKETTGHWPDFADKNDLAILGAEVVAFANVARFALPLRIGLAITTIPWVQGNVVDRFWPEAEEE